MKPGPVLSELLVIALLTEASEAIQEEILCHSDIDFNLADLHHSIDIKEDTSVVECRSDSSIRIQDKPFKCKTCGRKFTRKQGLTVHTRKAHDKNRKPFRCKFCDSRFAVKLSLAKHLITHTGEKLFTCEVCAEKPFGCHLCTKTYTHPSNLTDHLNSHTVEKLPFNCNICDCKFSYRGSLEYHLRNHNTEMKNAEKSAEHSSSQADIP